MNHSEAGKIGWLKSRDKIAAYHAKIRKKYEDNPKICNNCKNPLSYGRYQSIKTGYKNHFCSHICSAKFYNASKIKVRLCKNCYKQLPVGCQAQNCSNECSGKYNYNLYIKKWLSGNIGGGTRYGISEHVRRYLFERYGRKCQKCNWAEINPITKVVPVQIEHKDGNWQNNKPENLEILCPNHHSLTPTFGGLNRGKGRKYRRDSYARKV